MKFWLAVPLVVGSILSVVVGSGMNRTEDEYKFHSTIIDYNAIIIQ